MRYDRIASQDLATEDQNDNKFETPTSPDSWRALFYFATAKHIPTSCAAIGASIFAGLTQPTTALLLGRVFDTFTSYAAQKIDDETFKALLSGYCTYLIALAAAAWLIDGLYLSTWMTFGDLQAQSARERVFAILLQKELSWFDMRETGTGALLSDLQMYIRELQLATSQPLGHCVKCIISTFACASLALYCNWKLTLVILCTVPLIAYCSATISCKLGASITSHADRLSVAMKHILHTFTSIETIKTLNCQKLEARRLTSSIAHAAQPAASIAFWNALQLGFIAFTMLALFAQGFWYGSYLVTSGATDAFRVMATFWACLEGSQAFMSMFPQLLIIKEGEAAGSKLYDLVEDVSEIAMVDCDEDLPDEPCDVVFTNLSFAYPTQPSKSVLSNVSIIFSAGQTTFLVGKSGSGKSTVAQLLLRLYNPSVGYVSLAGRDIHTYDLRQLRQYIGTVEQQPILFNASVRDNIILAAKASTHPAAEHVDGAIDFAHLRQAVSDMTAGLDTMVGHSGNALSGGQQQRLALARAYIRDTPLLVLDEPTSALDQITRSSIHQAIRAWRTGKTTVIVTHDMTQIEADDIVVVMDGGRVVAEGTRKSLETASDSVFLNSFKAGRSTFTGDGQSKYCLELATDADIASESQTNVHRDYGEDITTQTVTRLSPGRRSATFNVEMQVFEPISPFTRPSHGMTIHVPSWRVPLVASPMSPYTPRLPSTAELPQYASPRRASFALPLSSPFGSSPSSLSPPFTISSRLQTSPKTPRSAVRFASLDWGLPDEGGGTDQPTIPHAGRKSSDARLHGTDRPRASSESTASAAKLLSATSGNEEPESVYPPSVPAFHGSGASSSALANYVLATTWQFLDSQQKLLLMLGCTLAVVQGATIPVFTFVFSKLIQTFYGYPGHDHHAFSYSMAILGIAAVNGATSFSAYYLLEYCAQKWVDQVRKEAVQRLLDQPLTFHEEEPSNPSLLAETLGQCAEETRCLLGQFAGRTLLACVMSVVAIIWSLRACWKLTIVILISAPGLYAVTFGFQTISSKWEGLVNDAHENLGLQAHEALTKLPLVKTLTLETYLRKKHSEATKFALAVGVKRAMCSGLFFGMMDASVYLVTALLFWYGGTLAASGHFSVQDVVQTFCILIISMGQVTHIVSLIPQIDASLDAAGRLLRLAHLPRRSHEDHGVVKITQIGEILGHDLNFRYPSRPSQTVLFDVSFAIKAGSCVAIVGESGCGKSTIVSLLLKMYAISNVDKSSEVALGTSRHPLTISGHNIDQVHTSTLRTLVAVVPQKPILFPTTIAQNITYGLSPSHAFSSPENVREAAEAAGIDGFITSLPYGYDTIIGEGGSGVSGGQAQRIAIARAFVRCPQLLILDEATSGLDAENAGLVRDSLCRLRQRNMGMTVIIITHARPMMEIADRIIMLEEGRVAEEGSFAELAGQDGPFSRLLRGVSADDVADAAQSSTI